MAGAPCPTEVMKKIIEKLNMKNITVFMFIFDKHQNAEFVYICPVLLICFV